VHPKQNPGYAPRVTYKKLSHRIKATLHVDLCRNSLLAITGFIAAINKNILLRWSTRYAAFPAMSLRRRGSSLCRSMCNMSRMPYLSEFSWRQQLKLTLACRLWNSKWRNEFSASNFFPFLGYYVRLTVDRDSNL